MKKLLVDTNIIIDLLAKRKNYYHEAQELFTLADRNSVSLYISSLTFAHTYYILSKYLNTNEVRKILTKFKLLVKVLSLDDKILDLALSSDLKDFEDSIQYFTAINNRLDLIISRNKKDFNKSEIPVLTAKEFLRK